MASSDSYLTIFIVYTVNTGLLTTYDFLGEISKGIDYFKIAFLPCLASSV